MTQGLELANDFATAALVAWLNTVWATALAAGAALAGLRLAKRMNAATRYVVWWAVIGFVAGAPLVHHLASRNPRPASTPVASGVVSPPVNAVIMPDAAPASLPAPPPAAQLRWDMQAGLLPAAFLGVWCTILILQLGRVFWSYLWLARLKRKARPAPARLRAEFDEWVLATGIKRRVRLLICDGVESPVAVGFHGAAVILPSGIVEELDPRDIDHVLLHELGHLARRDDWTNLLTRVLTGAFALDPVARFALGRIDREREIACDDWVVTATGAARDYAVSLSRLVEFGLERRGTLLASGVAGRGTEIADRVYRLLEAGRDFTSSISPLRAAAAVAVLAALTVVCAVAPPWVVVAQEPPPTPPVADPAPPAGVPVPAPPEARAPGAAAATRMPRAPREFVPPAPAPLPEPAHAGAPVLPAAPPAAAATPLPVALASAQAPPRPPAAPRAVARAQGGYGSSLLAALVANGYGELSVDEIIDLKNQGVTGDYLADMTHAWGKLTPRQIIDAKVHGVMPDYAARVRAAGLRDISPAGIIELRQHNVDPVRIREIHALGFGPYTVRQAIDLGNNGVRPELFRALKEYGIARPDLRDVIDAHNQGLRPEHIREAAKIGNSLTIRQLVKLKTAGVI